MVQPPIQTVPNRDVFVFAGVLLLLNLPISAIVLIGGWRMQQLQSYGLAVTACILAILPCTIVWFIGLPLGLWALFVLVRPDVRGAFAT